MPETFPLTNGDPGDREPFDEATGGWGPLPTLSPIEVLSPETEAKLAEYTRIHDSRQDLLLACRAFVDHQDRFVDAGAADGPLPDDLIESFARSFQIVYDMMKSAIAKAEGATK